MRKHQTLLFGTIILILLAFVGCNLPIDDLENKSTPSTAKEITAFSFLVADNSALTRDIPATITGTDIQATVLYGTDHSALVPTIVHTGSSISPASGTAQDYSSGVIYTVTAQDGSTQEYTVTITIEAALTKAELITMITEGDDVTNVNTSQITNMDNLFRASSFNQDISSWKFSSLEAAGWMFKNAKAFYKDISSWSEHFPETEITHVDFSAGDCPLPLEFYPASWNL